MLKKFLLSVFAAAVVLTSTGLSSELLLNLNPRPTFPHSGSYTDGYLEDTTGRVIQELRINHGASWVDNSILIPFRQGGWGYGYYTGPGGWRYPSRYKKLICYDYLPACYQAGGQNTQYDTVDIARDTRIKFLHLGRAATNKDAYIVFQGNNGLAASNPVKTDSNGQAVFLPPAGMVVTGGLNTGDGQIRFDSDNAFYSQSDVELVILQEGTPQPTYLESWAVGNGVNVAVWIEWEQLTYPGHAGYQIAIYDANTGNQLSGGTTVDPEVGFYGVPGGSYAFQITAIDTKNRAYTQSYVYTVNIPASHPVRAMANSPISSDKVEVKGETATVRAVTVFNTKVDYDESSKVEIPSVQKAKSFTAKNTLRGAVKIDPSILPLSASVEPGNVE